MLFCPKCGSMMSPKEEKGKRYFACSCGYTTKNAAQTSAPKTTIKEVVRDVKKEAVAVVTEGDTTLPLTDEQCPKCKHPRAFWWTKQMRASDEPETKFLKCESCKYSWRDRN
ncbi:TPA: transcription factor S [Candidatus Woesearchaeota archaeon]|nr:transcription factor S [Candidatus Woesearchaeota archaeon]